MSVTREGARVPREEQEGSSVAELLGKHFDTAFAAPDGIKKLRELILTLAMQGKLVPQDPDDKPASELLKEIAAERKRLVKEGGLRTEANEQIEENEKYLTVPYGWEYRRLGNLARFIDYRGKTPTKVDSGIPLITAKNVRFGYINREPYEYVTENEYESWMTRGFPKNGDLLFTTEAPLGNIAVIDIQERFALAQRVICFQLHEPGMACFVKRLIMSVSFQKQLLNNATGMTATGLKSSKLKEIPIPIPPLAEQQRIVAKIDQLMARCDELEKLRAEREQKRLTVHTAALNRLLKASECNDSNSAWRFITQHFGELYSVKENVAELRKAILQLAVMGKLVSQDSHDQPASELLKEIAAEKRRLVKEGKIKAQKPLPEIKPEDIPFVLPKGWELVRLGSVSISSDSGWSPQCLSESRSGTEWGVLKVSAVSWGEFKPDENKALPLSMEPRPECEVRAGDFLLSRANTQELVARSVVVKTTPPRLMMSDKIVRFNFPETIAKDFINSLNSTNFIRDYYISNASGTSSSMKNISREAMCNLPIPLPPLAEQHRIVAKIDQIMALCDELEQRIDDATGKRTALINVVMAQV